MKNEPNALIHETSPYLLQHAYNPVRWYPWSKKVLEMAKAENKLILVSIGYAACHWCHVMEHECFENQEVAEIMNELFVNIKVDREERPDVDHFFMDAVQLMNGNGGWPLNCICLPDGRPVFGGTYFPKDKWLRIIKDVDRYINQNPKASEEVAGKVLQGIQQMESPQNLPNHGDFQIRDLPILIDNFLKNVDYLEGGFDKAPKFPTPVNWQFLLRYSTVFPSVKIDKILKLTFDKIAQGGIYDQIGGGFARYSVDREWFVPHFEKMLYDNAQLIHLYCEAWQKYRSPLYKKVVFETIAFLESEMMNSQGGFYSSLDADSEGIEGKYYIWTAKELNQILQEDFPVFQKIFSIREEGNWEHDANILIFSKTIDTLANEFHLSVENFLSKIEEWRKKLQIVRNQRIRPATDDKIILSWNAMTIKSLAYASQVFQQPKWLQLALKANEFIQQNLRKSQNQFYRTFRENKAQIDAFLEDYAFWIEAQIELYRATAEPKFLLEASECLDFVIENFYDDANQVFLFCPKTQNELPLNKTELFDSVIPSSNSTMMNILLTFYHLTLDITYKKRIEAIVKQLKPVIIQYPSSHGNWAFLVTRLLVSESELVVSGQNSTNEISAFQSSVYQPFVLTFPIENEMPFLLFRGKNVPERQFFYCVEGTCKSPMNTLQEVLNILETSK